MAGVGTTDLLYGSKGIPAAYRHAGSLAPHEPCPDATEVRIVEAREETRYSDRRVGTDMGDVTFCEGSCGKLCGFRVPAEGCPKLQQRLKD